MTPALISSASKLKYIGRAGSGTDNIDSQFAQEKGIKVMNTPGGNTNATAELTISLMMTLQRNLYNATEHIKNGDFNRKEFVGQELAGKTLGVVGYGAIGRQVAQKAIGLGMNVIAYDNFVTTEQPDVTITKNLDDIWSSSDIITFHTPLTKDTKNLLNKETIKKCKDGFKAVNCARGGLVNESDIYDALESGKCGGLVLDVFSNEKPKPHVDELLKKLIEHKKVVCTPHLGASTHEAQDVVAEMIATQISDGLLEGVDNHVVNSKDSLPKPTRMEFSSGPTIK